MQRIGLCVTAGLLVACGPRTADRGRIRVVVSTQGISIADITRVNITVTPAGVSQDLSLGGDGTFSGSLSVTPGLQTVTAAAYRGQTLAGSGSAQVTVVAAANASVNITIYDSGPPPPPPDHSPVILSFVVPNTNAMVGANETLTATAMDADQDPITFEWSVSPAGCGVFSNPTSTATTAATEWAGTLGGPCTVTITATANGKSDVRSTSITVVQAVGSLDVSGRYVPQPFITHIGVYDGAAWWDFPRSGTNATSTGSLATGGQHEVRAYFDPVQSPTVTLTDSCGGGIIPSGSGASGSEAYAAFAWTAPPTANACILTVSLTVPGPVGDFHDTFPIVVRVGL